MVPWRSCYYSCQCWYAQCDIDSLPLALCCVRMFSYTSFYRRCVSREYFADAYYVLLRQAPKGQRGQQGKTEEGFEVRGAGFAFS